MTLGRDTFGLTKTDFNEKLSRIITNHRAGSLLIGEPSEFILRACKLTERWNKMASDPKVEVRLRNLEIAGGRRVKMISLERGITRQPVGKAKLINELYPVKKIATAASPEEKHYNAVKSAMRGGVLLQLKDFRSSVTLPTICAVTGLKIRKGQRTDVDHVGLTFSEIADNFIAKCELKYTDIPLVGPPTAKRFKDDELWELWKDFHRAFAKYALVHESANRSKGADGYTTPDDLYGSFAADDPDSLSLDF
jgi:hypothetical protein